MSDNLEFNNEQCERIDEVYNAVFEMCKVLTEKEDLEWNMEYIGEIADVACDILVDCGFKVHFPARITEGKSGKQYITDWHNEEVCKTKLDEIKNLIFNAETENLGILFATETHDNANNN